MAYRRNIESGSDDFTYKGNAVVKNPNFEPYTNWMNAMWVHMIPLKLESQSSEGRGGSLSIGGENRPTFAFLAPKSISENINHTWEGFDSIQSRLMGKVVGAAKLNAEISAFKNSIGRIANNIKSIGDIKSQSLFQAAKNAAGNIAGTNVPKFKVDTPLRYMDSGRREIVLEFILMSSAKNVIAEGSSMGAKGHGTVINSNLSEVHNIVRDLMMYSAPAIKDTSSIEYEFTYIWRLETAPNGFLIYEFCALTSVQPTWNTPYIKGYPSNCTVTLTFKDLSPLFRSTISKGSSINVIDTSNVAALTEEEWIATFEQIKPTTNKSDNLKALLDARTKFKRAQSMHKSLISGNQASVLKYFGNQGEDVVRRFFDSSTQRKIGDAIPMGKTTPNLISKFPRL